MQRSRCILQLSGKQGGQGVAQLYSQTSMYHYAEVAGEGAEVHLISLTLLLKVSMPLLMKGVFTLLATTRHKKMLTISLTQLETGVTPIWVIKMSRSTPRS